jgi:hypothetical protein
LLLFPTLIFLLVILRFGLVSLGLLGLFLALRFGLWGALLRLILAASLVLVATTLLLILFRDLSSLRASI